jgi:hypothetical protein
VAYALLCLRFTCLVRDSKSHSATGARLDTGGWLNLTRQGLPPCKVHQTALGALTAWLSGASDSEHPLEPMVKAQVLGRRTRL